MVLVRRHDAGTKAVDGVVRPCNHLVVVFVGHNLHHWAKNLLPRNRHVVLDICEDGRLDEITHVASAFATAEKICAIAHATLDVSKHLLKLSFVHLWSLRPAMWIDAASIRVPSFDDAP